VTGNELRALRLEWGMTQLQLAHLIEHDVKTVSEMENGRKAVPKMLEKVLFREKVIRDVKKLLDSIDTHQ
jgi:DNA-binding XRE family transcriptional regulator